MMNEYRELTFVVDPAKIFFTSSLITMPNFIVVYHTVRAHVHEVPKTLGTLAPCTHWDGDVADPRETRICVTMLP